jgi:hypothetical protein
MELDNNFYTRALTRGTPQGGVLSPLIWNINFDSILEELNKGPIKVIGFADDAAILIAGIDPKTMVQKIQTPINKIVAWGAASGLAFNPSKTVAVFFTNKQDKISSYTRVKVNNLPIKYSEEAKYLGIALDSKLTWTSHVKNKVAKAKRLLFAIKSCVHRNVGPRLDITRQAFKTLVVPVLSYGSHVFANNLNKTHRMDLEKLSRLACLSLGSVPRSTPTSTMEILYNLRPLDLELEATAIKTFSRINKCAHLIGLRGLKYYEKS